MSRSMADLISELVCDAACGDLRLRRRSAEAAQFLTLYPRFYAAPEIKLGIELLELYDAGRRKKPLADLVYRLQLSAAPELPDQPRPLRRYIAVPPFLDPPPGVSTRRFRTRSGNWESYDPNRIRQHFSARQVGKFAELLSVCADWIEQGASAMPKPMVEVAPSTPSPLLRTVLSISAALDAARAALSADAGPAPPGAPRCSARLADERGRLGALAPSLTPYHRLGAAAVDVQLLVSDPELLVKPTSYAVAVEGKDEIKPDDIRSRRAIALRATMTGIDAIAALRVDLRFEYLILGSEKTRWWTRLLQLKRRWFRKTVADALWGGPPSNWLSEKHISEERFKRWFSEEATRRAALIIRLPSIGGYPPQQRALVLVDRPIKDRAGRSRPLRFLFCMDLERNAGSLPKWTDSPLRAYYALDHKEWRCRSEGNCIASSFERDVKDFAYALSKALSNWQQAALTEGGNE